MSHEDFIITLFRKHPQLKMHPSEIVTMAILFVIKGVGNRAFYRWMVNNWLYLFPGLPERTRLFRLFKKHGQWANQFLADPTLLGVIDSYGIEFIHPTLLSIPRQEILPT